MIVKYLIKVWNCYIWRFHDWTCKAQEGEKPVLPKDATTEQLMESFYEYAKMYCKRCGHESELNKKYLKNNG